MMYECRLSEPFNAEKVRDCDVFRNTSMCNTTMDYLVYQSVYNFRSIDITFNSFIITRFYTLTNLFRDIYKI